VSRAPILSSRGARVLRLASIIDKVVGGKVHERWEQFDQSLMLQQLGFA